MKKFFYILIPVLVLMILVAAGVWIWAYYTFYHTEPLGETEMVELTPDWSGVTRGNWSPWVTGADGAIEWGPIRGFNGWLAGVPEEEKAWPVLIDLVIGHPELFEHEALGDISSESEGWGELAELIESPEGVLVVDQMVEALRRPVLGCGLYVSTGTYQHRAMVKHGVVDTQWDPSPDLDPLGLDILLPALGPLRGSTKLLKSVAFNELVDGDADRFVELVVVMIDSARHAEEYPVLIGQLVRIAMVSVACDMVLLALEQHPELFTDEQLAQLSDAIRRSPRTGFWWEGEALFFHDAIRHMVGANGAIDPAKIDILKGGSGGSVPSSIPDAQLHSSIQRLMLVYKSVLKQAEVCSEVPWDPSLVSPEVVFDEQKDSLDKVGEILMDVLMPAMGQAAARFQGSVQESIGTRVVIALHRHRLRHGAFPASIDGIDDDLLDFEPTDIFTGGQLRYVLGEDGPMVYALGQDRDDDGGRYASGVMSVRADPADADWPMFSNSKIEELYPDD